MAIALIVAAGSGERLGAGRPKALVELAGRPMLEWSLLALGATAQVEQIVVALPRGTSLSAPAAVDAIGVEGGATRSQSVRHALAAADAGDPVLVHDAARPLVTPALAGELLAALEREPSADAAIAAVPVSDTVKQVHSGTDVVSHTLDRRSLWAVQTPQVFRRRALERALDVSAEVLAQATDDAWLIERGGGRVIVVPSSEENIKVTTRLDLDLAELLLARRGERVDGAGAGSANPA
jgi:2-C-methyl-D-erythritol 4-phosphate cytidylyltransferase